MSSHVVTISTASALAPIRHSVSKTVGSLVRSEPLPLCCRMLRVLVTLMLYAPSLALCAGVHVCMCVHGRLVPISDRGHRCQFRAALVSRLVTKELLLLLLCRRRSLMTTLVMSLMSEPVFACPFNPSSLPNRLPNSSMLDINRALYFGTPVMAVTFQSFL